MHLRDGVVHKSHDVVIGMLQVLAPYWLCTNATCKGCAGDTQVCIGHPQDSHKNYVLIVW